MISLDVVKNHAAVVDQCQIDITWERTQEQAMQAYVSKNTAKARASWAKALDIAERHFERGDPRIAASLSNQAFSLLRQGQTHQARLLFQRAVVAWEDSWCWIPWMTPSSQSGGPEPVAYDQVTQDAFYALIKKGKAITEALWHEGVLPEVVGDDWSSVKPKSMNDIRRLFGAVFLMPTASPR